MCVGLKLCAIFRFPAVENRCVLVWCSVDVLKCKNISCSAGCKNHGLWKELIDLIVSFWHILIPVGSAWHIMDLRVPRSTAARIPITLYNTHSAVLWRSDYIIILMRSSIMIFVTFLKKVIGSRIIVALSSCLRSERFDCDRANTKTVHLPYTCYYN